VAAANTAIVDAESELATATQKEAGLI